MRCSELIRSSESKLKDYHKILLMCDFIKVLQNPELLLLTNSKLLRVLFLQTTDLQVEKIVIVACDKDVTMVYFMLTERK